MPLYRKGFLELKEYWDGVDKASGKASTAADVYLIVAAYADFCFGLGTEAGLSYKARLNYGVFGLLYAYPHLDGKLPVTANALKGSDRMWPSAELPRSLGA